MDRSGYDPEIPPPARMPGIDPIAEGTLTLGPVAAMPEAGDLSETARLNAANRIAAVLEQRHRKEVFLEFR